MCIRDRQNLLEIVAPLERLGRIVTVLEAEVDKLQVDRRICLLYTSDAADERSSVDLGGRRIIKKKKTKHNRLCRHDNNKTQNELQNPRRTN